MKLYYHKTDGSAQYLCSSQVYEVSNFTNKEEIQLFSDYEEARQFANDTNGELRKTNEGSFNSKYVVRIDGDLSEDCELTIN